MREDIKSSFLLNDLSVFIGSFDRPNIFYGVKLIKNGSRSLSSIVDLFRDVPRWLLARESTIIYCATIKDTEQACALNTILLHLFIILSIVKILFFSKKKLGPRCFVVPRHYFRNLSRTIG